MRHPNALVGAVLLEDVDEAHRILDDAAPVQRILAKMGRSGRTGKG